MSKPVKALIRDELIKRFDGVTQLAVVGFTGVEANATNRIRARLREKEIRVLVVKNALAKQAFKAVGIAVAGELLDGPCAVAYGCDPDSVGIVAVVRELLEIHKEEPKLTVKAALLDGEVFRGDRIEALSMYPTRDEAIAQLVGCVLWPGSSLAACLTGPGGQLAGAIAAIGEGGGEEAESPQEGGEDEAAE